jgi:hypothetical protein
MKKISELTRDTQILCETDEQRTAVFKLCEQSGKKYDCEILEPFIEYPNVWVSVSYNEFWECSPQPIIAAPYDTLPATDFLPLSHFTDNPNDPQTHSANC